MLVTLSRWLVDKDLVSVFLHLAPAVPAAVRARRIDLGPGKRVRDGGLTVLMDDILAMCLVPKVLRSAWV